MPSKIKSMKLYIRLPEERLKEVRELSEEVGIPYTLFGGMLLWMGYHAYLRQLHPEKAFTIEQLIDIGKRAQEITQEQDKHAPI
jgi:hypothetical protein